jgi:hypothetical protein
MVKPFLLKNKTMTILLLITADSFGCPLCGVLHHVFLGSVSPLILEINPLPSLALGI